MKTLSIIALLLSLTAPVVSAESAEYRPLSFDGKQFVEGGLEGMPQLYVGTGLLPVAEGQLRRPAPLPAKSGALAVFCYMAAGAGKRGTGPTSIPVASFPVEIAGKTTTSVIRTDCSGFAVMSLPAGVYRITAGNSTRKIEITPGQTATMAFTTGKRSY